MLKKHRIVRFVNLKVTFLKTKSEANNGSNGGVFVVVKGVHGPC